MAELITLARPYAKAAFEYARSEKDLDGWSQSLALIASVVQQSAVKKLLDSPTHTSTQKADALFDVCGKELIEKVKNFVAVLAENKRLSLLAEVQALFEDFKSQQEKFSDVTVSSAFELDKKVEEQLSEKLGKVLSSEVSLTTEIDKALIGGVVVRAGDMVVDGSIKGRLGKLAESMGL